MVMSRYPLETPWWQVPRLFRRQHRPHQVFMYSRAQAEMEQETGELSRWQAAHEAAQVSQVSAPGRPGGPGGVGAGGAGRPWRRGEAREAETRGEGLQGKGGKGGLED